MPEYIERKAVLKIIDDRSIDTNSNAIDIIRSAVHKLPAVDAAPVSHGHWVHLGEDECVVPIADSLSQQKAVESVRKENSAKTAELR